MNFLSNLFLFGKIKKLFFKLRLTIGIDLTVIIQGPISPKRALILSLLYKITSPFITVIISQYSTKKSHYYLTNYFAKIIKNKIINDIHGVEVNAKRSNNSISNNINLQILTTKNALTKTTSSYSIKTRSDCFFWSISILFLPYYFFKENRILVINYSIPPLEVFLNSPCISDWFFFGKTEDIFNGFSRYMPTKYLNCSNHINYKVQKYYKSENYTDFFQAEEFITWALIFPEKEPSLENLLLFLNNENIFEKIKQMFLITYGPSISLINLGTKPNFWNPDFKSRPKLNDLNSISLNTFGLLSEKIFCRVYLFYKKIKRLKINKNLKIFR